MNEDTAARSDLEANFKKLQKKTKNSNSVWLVHAESGVHVQGQAAAKDIQFSSPVSMKVARWSHSGAMSLFCIRSLSNIHLND